MARDVKGTEEVVKQNGSPFGSVMWCFDDSVWWIRKTPQHFIGRPDIEAFGTWLARRLALAEDTDS